jgi:hypothetical protein
VTEFKEGKGAKTYWRKNAENNHWLDATYMAAAASEACGIKLLAPSEQEVSPRVENKAKEKVEMEIKINRHSNEKIKKEKEELKEQYKEVFKTNPLSIIKKCCFCKTLRIYPYHFKDENDKPFLRAYTKDKKQEKASCCVDCFEEVEIKKEEKKITHTYHCSICDKSFVAYTNELYVSHLQSIKHKRNEAKSTGKNDLSLLKILELHNICSKTVDENGLCRISNYTRLKKAELLEKMNSIYDLLVFT